MCAANLFARRTTKTCGKHKYDHWRKNAHYRPPARETRSAEIRAHRTLSVQSLNCLSITARTVKRKMTAAAGGSDAGGRRRPAGRWCARGPEKTRTSRKKTDCRTIWQRPAFGVHTPWNLILASHPSSTLYSRRVTVISASKHRRGTPPWQHVGIYAAGSDFRRSVSLRCVSCSFSWLTF